MLIEYIPQQYQPFLLQTYFNNTIEAYIVGAILFVVFIFIFKIFQLIIVSRLEKLAKKTKTDIDDTFIEIIKSLRPPFYFFLSFYLAAQTLTFPTYFSKGITIILTIWVVYQVIRAVGILIDFVVKKRLGNEEERSARGAIALLSIISKIIIWSFGLLFILQNLGINVTSLIAGLGIGGVAIAFALQKILGDLFSSFAIYFDKPFIPGDFIVVGDKAGTVEKIGIKTTRIRALQGEEVVFSNTDLTATVIQNFKKMSERRISFTVGVTYDTPLEKLKLVPGFIKEIFKEVDGARLDRAHFSKFNNSSLDIEIVYYVQSGDYNMYMDINQKVLFAIKETFEKEKLIFAYPTQTLYIEK